MWIFFFFKALLNSRSLKVFISNALLLLLQFLQANKRRRPHCVDQISHEQSSATAMEITRARENVEERRWLWLLMYFFLQRVGVIMHVALYYQAEIITHSSVLASCMISVQLLQITQCTSRENIGWKSRDSSSRQGLLLIHDENNHDTSPALLLWILSKGE